MAQYVLGSLLDLSGRRSYDSSFSTIKKVRSGEIGKYLIVKFLILTGDQPGVEAANIC